MITHTLTVGIPLLLLLVVLGELAKKCRRFQYHLGDPSDKTTSTFHETAAAVRRLLSPGRPLAKLLAERAGPNQRLVQAFELTNTFVTGDPDVHRRFRDQTLKLLDVVRKDWTQFRETAREAAKETLQDHQHKGGLEAGSLSYHQFVQHTTMRVVLVGILQLKDQQPGTRMNGEDIDAASSLITELWATSKQNIHPANTTARLEKLNHHLHLLIPPALDHLYPNPLDFVIPSWETLWRVVAVTIAYTHNSQSARSAFSALHQCPTAAQFHQFITFQGGHLPSVESLVAEAMRLHPPSKRITRTNLADDSLNVAQIETVQLSAKTWGDDALEYDAMRHHSTRLTLEQRQSLLAFGHGPLSCVAKTWAPMAVGLISAEIMEELSEHALEVRKGPRIGGREGWEGWSIESGFVL